MAEMKTHQAPVILNSGEGSREARGCGRFRRPRFFISFRMTDIGKLSLILILAFTLRSWHLSTDLLFHRDQGLHSLSIWNIWHEKKISLLGHPSDVDGLTHAPVYYYLMLPAYALSAGDPVVASLFQITLEAISLPFLYLAIKKLFNKKTAFFTLLIYAVSYGGIGLSRWLVNVTPVLPFTNLLLFLLTRQTSGGVTKDGPKPRHSCVGGPLGPLWGNLCKSFWLIFLTSLIVGIITQLNAAIGTFLLPFLFWFYRSRLNLKTVGLILSGFLLPALPLVAFELRHNFVITQAILSFSGRSSHGLGLDLGVFTTNLGVLFTEINKIISYPYVYISGTLFIFGLLKVRNLKQAQLIYAFLLIPFIGLSFFQRGAIGFFFVPLIPLSIAIIAYGLQTLPHLFSLSLVTVILLLNLTQLPNVYQPNNALTPIGNANIITIQDRKNIIDFIYQEAGGKQFAVWFYTIPYFQEEVWDYMFLYYAKPKHGYLPEQTSGFSPNDLKTSVNFFSVYEPDQDQPTKLNSWQKGAVKNFGQPTNSYTSHDLHVNLHSWIR